MDKLRFRHGLPGGAGAASCGGPGVPGADTGVKGGGPDGSRRQGPFPAGLPIVSDVESHEESFGHAQILQRAALGAEAASWVSWWVGGGDGRRGVGAAGVDGGRGAQSETA